MKNQPIILADKVKIALSTTADGDIDVRKNNPNSTNNACEFLTRNDFDINQTMLIYVTYNCEEFTKFAIADQTWAGNGMTNNDLQSADGLATRTKNLGLFLPLADCLGAVIFDPQNEVLAMAHLGRHATEQFAAEKFIKFICEKFDSKATDLHIWLSPAAGRENYPLYKFNHRSLREVNVEQFIAAGVKPENITGENIDTTTDDNYFSHSQGDVNKRFAIAAKIIS